ncbi:MAG: sensor histidine kinase [Christensenellales bacterium]|jgi:signal transduction histidine kinase
MKRRKPFQTLWAAFLGITIPCVILLLFLHNSMIRTMEQSNLDMIGSNQSMIVSSVEDSLLRAFGNVQGCVDSMDFLVFCNSSGAERVTKYATLMNGKLRDAFSGFPEIIGFVLYNAACDRYYFTNLQPIEPEIYALLTFEASKPAGAGMTAHALIPLEETTLAVTYYRNRHGTLAVLADPCCNESYQAYTASVDGTHDLQFLPLDARSTEYISAKEFRYFPMQIVMREYRSAFLRGYNATQLLISILIVILISAILLVGRAMQKQLIEPLRRLWEAFGRISQEDTAYRIEERSSMKEINDFYDGFNKMLDDMQAAQLQRIKSQLDAAQAQLQYFQLQIRPHFYLNCLKNINALASIHEDGKIQEMVFLMSDYLRYLFQDNRSFLTLREELAAVQGYAQLCQLMGRQLRLSFNLESETLHALCLPMLALTFLENSIKHSRQNDLLEIRIEAKLKLSDEGEPFAELSIRDDGSGFSAESLEALNNADPSQMYYGKEHIGIANVRYRLWLAYGDRAGITFRNDKTHAVVEIHFPIRPEDSR